MHCHSSKTTKRCFVPLTAGREPAANFGWHWPRWTYPLVPKPVAKWLAIFGAATGLIYGLILLDASWLKAVGIETRSGAIDYWSKMYKVNIGTEELRWPLWVQELFGVKDRVQRWFVLIILPISLALLSYRSLQAMIQIYLGKREMVIAGHEAEELVKDNKNILKD